MDNQNKLIPRRLWILWFQGASEAPFIVNKCIDSWVEKNPNWDIVVLDSGNLDNYINLDMPEAVLQNLSRAHQSDLYRLLLLIKYGGVWADATTYCTKPLDEWIDEYAESGFFVFHKPGIDRIMSNWFIASKKDSPVCDKLYDRLSSYFIENNFKKPNRVQRKAKSILSKILNRSTHTTKYWFNPIVSKLLKVYPYFVFHYMFERLVSRDNECKAIWKNTKRISADAPHLIQKHGLFSSPSQAIKKQINDNQIPLFKLSWKYDHSRYSEGTLLHYLIEERKV